MLGGDPFTRWSVLAHIIGMRPPNLWSWLAALALFGGLLGVVVAGTRTQRIACAVLALAGLAGSIDDVIARSARPPRPDLLIRLASPSRTATNPLVVTVCGTTRTGRPAAVIADGRYLLIHLDGEPVAELHASSTFFSASPGQHILTVEITSRDHQEFQPPLLVRRLVRVTGEGAPHAPPCP